MAAEAQERFADHVGAEKVKEIERLAGLEERFGELDGMVALLKSIASKVEAAPRRFLAPTKKLRRWASRLQFGIAR